jgi:hypothetical protein
LKVALLSYVSESKTLEENLHIKISESSAQQHMPSSLKEPISMSSGLPMKLEHSTSWQVTCT